MLFVGACCGGWSIGGVGVGVTGNIIVACCRASLMILGACLYMVRNSSGVSMVMVSLFWICVSVVIPRVYNLFKYF